jgi:tRNA modification GTPase
MSENTLMYIDGDTIVAAATPTGESAIAIVRASGVSCKALFEVCAGSCGLEPRKAVHGAYKASDGHIVDDCIFIYYESGHSYTGEDMLEIFSHGNPLIVQRLVSDLISRGCRAAEPGEFTRRAFLNGRMDLTQAEAVQEIIGARSAEAIEAARRQLEGSVGKAVNNLLERLIGVIARIEAYIDFPEEDLPTESENGPIAELIGIKRDANRLIATAPYSAMLREGALAVIVGAPNAGKSSLMNAMLCEDRSIVSSEPGTTRDYIEERLIIGRHLVRIADTAGLREGGGEIEKRGMEKSMELLNRADIVILVIDATLPHPAYMGGDIFTDARKLIVAENKCDLPNAANLASVQTNAQHVRISALTGDGIDDVKNAIIRVIESSYKAPGQDAVVVSARHAESLSNMSQCIESSICKLRSNEPAELVACELRLALESLEGIVGKVDKERVLDEIFSKFCIGK